VSPAETTDLGHVEGMLRDARGGDRSGSVRAITLNLVVRTPSSDAAAEATETLERIGPTHPLRAIVAVPATGGPRASVDTSCWTGSADRQVCSERIHVEAEPDALPSAVLALLVPDLPVFLWWRGPLEPADAVEELAALADRLIVDSGECGLESVEAARRLSPSVSDLAWVGLLPWRDAVAALFDGAGGLKALRTLRCLEVEGPDNEARLIGGWLRAQLGEDVGVTRSGRGRRLERVTLECGDGPYVVERPGRGRLGRAWGPDVPEHAVVLAARPRASLLTEELSRLTGDPVFERSLAVA
jgi:glucose-6-phosphate dehydrogenase assembly protein OpcA